jgi:DNA-binding MarR family transcriptional regulator
MSETVIPAGSSSGTPSDTGKGTGPGNGITMAQRLEPLELWRRVHQEIVRSDAPDLTIRQYSILLTIYMNEPPHTVRGLAAGLNISKPAVVRALDTLSGLGFIKRKVDANDRRSVLLQRTVPGSVFLSEFADLMQRVNWDYAAERGDPFKRTGY